MEPPPSRFSTSREGIGNQRSLDSSLASICSLCQSLHGTWVLAVNCLGSQSSLFKGYLCFYGNHVRIIKKAISMPIRFLGRRGGQDVTLFFNLLIELDVSFGRPHNGLDSLALFWCTCFSRKWMLTKYVRWQNLLTRARG